MSSRSVGVQLQGRDYQIRSDADAEWLQRVAGYVDNAMNQIREQTNTVDTLDVALLTSLNLARELVASRAGSGKAGKADNNLDSQRLKSLIELVESTGAGLFDRSETARSGGSETPLLTLPTGEELDGLENDLLAPLDSTRSTAATGADPGGGRG